MYGLKTVPSKSCLHHIATVIADYDWLHEIMEMQAGSHARGSLLGDSTGVAINQYADWEDAKRGLISRREFVKLHVIVDARGRKIVSCAVTIGRAHDSPVFREMFGKVPDGTECVMLDAVYDAVRNYKMIRDPDRRPVICTRKNHVARGFGPRAKMIRWQEKNPEEFENTYHRRSIGIRVLVVQVQVHCRGPGKNAANPKAAAAAQVRLLQPVVIKIMQEMHVMCLACAMHIYAVLARDAPHHVPATKKSRHMDGIRTNKMHVKVHQIGRKN